MFNVLAEHYIFIIITILGFSETVYAIKALIARL